MRFLDRSLVALLVTLLVALSVSACSGEEKQPAGAPPAAPNPPGVQAPAEEPGVDVPALPSQEEADAKAAATIGKENADLELEKIKKELGGG